MKAEKSNGLPPEVMEELRKPFPDAAYSDASFGAKQLTSIKGIYIVERLNAVFGVGRWSLEWENMNTYDRQWISTTSKGRERENFEVVIRGKLVLHDYPEFHGIPTMAGSDADSWTDACKGAVTALISKCSSFLEVGIDVYKGLVSVQNGKPIRKIVGGQHPVPATSIDDLVAEAKTLSVPLTEEMLIKHKWDGKFYGNKEMPVIFLVDSKGVQGARQLQTDSDKAVANRYLKKLQSTKQIVA